MLLVDHLLVTGYAMRAAARDLRAAGTATIYGYVLASGLRRGFQLLRLHIDTPSLRMILCLLLYYFVVSLKQGYVFFSAFSLFFSLALCQLDQRHRLALRWRSRRRYAELK